MSEELQKIDAVVAQLTQEGAPFALDTVTIDGAGYRNFSSAPPNMGAYFRFMLNHSDKEFTVYRDERLTFGESYAQ